MDGHAAETHQLREQLVALKVRNGLLMSELEVRLLRMHHHHAN